MVLSRQFVVSHNPETDMASFGQWDKSHHMGWSGYRREKRLPKKASS